MDTNEKLVFEGEDSLVYLRENKKYGKHLVKILRSSTPSLDQVVSFNNEFTITQDLNIKGIRRALYCEKKDEQYIIALEYIEGVTFDEAFSVNNLNLIEVLHVFSVLADLLSQLHNKGIVHKDLNGKNILLLADENRPVIIDFGISTRIDLISNNLGNPDKIKGTLTHMSPEQTGRVNRKVDSRSDLYSLGVTLFKVLTGELPFQSNDSLELVHFHLAKKVPLAHHINGVLPAVLSNIIVKLMAKNAEDRYQSAQGLKYDLDKCIAQLEKGVQVADFELGTNDYSGKFQIPQKLYGRKAEVASLLNSFERVSNGSTELFLVSGTSGVGKSVLVSELFKPITERRGYIVGGKFDQYQRNIPYYAFILAITEFCQLLLTEKKENLDRWSKQILNSLGGNGAILTDLIPALIDIIGPQPEVTKLEAQEALNRFNVVFLNFIKALSKPEHPFVLFIDDLQWADVGSLNLIKTLVTDLNTPYLLVIGAYRDNEVTAGHPLLNTIENAVKEKAVLHTIALKPLLAEHLFQIIKDILFIDDKTALQLTEIVFSKTLGNAFFTIEFLKSLNQPGVISYNAEKRKWEVNFEAIRKKKITNNVIDLLVSKIKELPQATQQVLQLASCIGGLFDLELLAAIYEKTEKETFNDLWPAVTEGLLVPVDEKYQYIEVVEERHLTIELEFAHDRIQQASYSLMTAGNHALIHLKIGRILLANHNISDDVIFDIVNHCNEGSSLITDATEKSNLAHLNLEAAIQARNSSAYKSALNYVTAAEQLAGDKVWEADYEFALALNKSIAEIEYLNGDFGKSQQRIHVCIEKAKTPSEKSDIYFMLMQNQSNSTQYYEAIDSARQGLKLLDFDFPAKEDCPPLIGPELGKVLTYFTEHGVESLFDKPDMKDQRLLSIMNILDNLSPPTYVTGETNMWMLHVLLKINLTIENGLSPQGGYALSELGLTFFIMGNYQFAYPCAMMSKRVVEKFRKESPRHLCRAGHLFTNYNTPWVKHIAETAKLNPEYYQISLDCGELIYAGYTSFHPFFNSFYQGKESLPALLLRIPDALEYTKKIQHDLAHDSLVALQLVMSNLAGATVSASSFDLPGKTGADLLAYCKEVNDGYGMTMFHLYKALAYYFYGNLTEALYCLEVVAGLTGVLAGNVVSHSNFNMLYALTLLGLLDKAADKKEEYLTKIETFKQQLKTWSEQNASNFEHKYLLVEAECERINGNALNAISYYSKAIESAELYEFEREVALIHQKAGEFWIANGNKLYAKPHLERARYFYEKLGYQRLVKRIDENYPFLLLNTLQPVSRRGDLYTTVYTQSNTTDIAGFDLKSVMKASHALSEEIVIDKLFEKILRIVIENAGGQRAVLLLQKSNKWNVEADLNLDEPLHKVVESRDLETANDIPVSLINYVIRTRTQVLSNSNVSNKIFERDEYFKRVKPSSYLCVPLTYKGATNGILYVEHKSSPEAFSNERIAVLEMLTGQMSVSLENAGLYQKQFELSQAYQRFVPTDFINAIGRQSILEVKLGDHIKQDMTVMFCDIRSYSLMSEEMSTEQNFNFINEYLRRVGPVIQKNNGFINHYFGDGFIALFKDNPENAIKAAIQILEEIDRYNIERLASGNKPIAVGFGLHKGPVMMGIIGDDERHDANVLSDAVNISSRLEGLTKLFGSSIVLSDSLYQAINANDFQFRFLGRIKVKGKEDVMGVYEMFSADDSKMKELKQKTLATFNKGLTDYFAKRFAEAALSLRQTLDANPEDLSAKRYLQNSARFMVEGVHPSWDGVEEMNEK